MSSPLPICYATSRTGPGSSRRENRTPAGYYRAEGLIKNVNTIEEYRNVDKTQTLQDVGKKVSLARPGVVVDRKRLIINHLYIVDMGCHP